MPDYDDKFFEYVNSGAVRSARAILPFLAENLSVSSVLDVGCGQGAWLSVWRELGVEDVAGIDGDYVDPDALLVPKDRFSAADLAKGFSAGRSFDLVQSLEVAEHLPSSESARFVSEIVAHGPMVVFSAAPKGQGGDHHINEQDYDFWRALFRQHGFVPLDCIRPEVLDNSDIEPWYRYNMFLYVHEDRLAQLPEALRACRVPDGVSLQDVSPLGYRVRKRFVRLLPVALATKIAKSKEILVARRRQHDG